MRGRNGDCECQALRRAVRFALGCVRHTKVFRYEKLLFVCNCFSTLGVNASEKVADRLQTFVLSMGAPCRGGADSECIWVLMSDGVASTRLVIFLGLRLTGTERDLFGWLTQMIVRFND